MDFSSLSSVLPWPIKWTLQIKLDVCVITVNINDQVFSCVFSLVLLYHGSEKYLCGLQWGLITAYYLSECLGRCKNKHCRISSLKKKEQVTNHWLSPALTSSTHLQYWVPSCCGSEMPSNIRNYCYFISAFTLVKLSNAGQDHLFMNRKKNSSIRNPHILCVRRDANCEQHFLYLWGSDSS